MTIFFYLLVSILINYGNKSGLPLRCVEHLILNHSIVSANKLNFIMNRSTCFFRALSKHKVHILIHHA